MMGADAGGRAGIDVLARPRAQAARSVVSTGTSPEWDLLQERSPDAQQTVLLLAGGLCGAGSSLEA
jgi:hypothetical protein